MDKQIDKLIKHIRNLENRLGEVDNNLRYIKVVQALKHSLDKLDDMLRNNQELQREYQAIYHRYFYTGCGFSFYDRMLKTVDIRSPKTGISVHYSYSLLMAMQIY